VELAEKVRENRVRRWAARLGYGISKSRAKVLHVDDYGRYMLWNERNYVVLGQRFDATLEDPEAFLEDEEDSLQAQRR
jgi:hypothetical protein